MWDIDRTLLNAGAELAYALAEAGAHVVHDDLSDVEAVVTSLAD